jgi:hypothetical protein
VYWWTQNNQFWRYVCLCKWKLFNFYKFVNISKSFIFTLLTLWLSTNLAINVYITLVPIFLSVSLSLPITLISLSLSIFTSLSFPIYLLETVSRDLCVLVNPKQPVLKICLPV